MTTDINDITDPRDAQAQFVRDDLARRLLSTTDRIERIEPRDPHFSSEVLSEVSAFFGTLFWRMFRPMVEQGRLYAAVPPLFIVKTGGKNPQTIYVETDADQDRLTNSLDAKHVSYTVSRLKGLGEMDPDSLGRSVTDPTTRILRQITAADAQASEEALDLAMGSHVEPRREWIINASEQIDETELDV